MHHRRGFTNRTLGAALALALLAGDASAGRGSGSSGAAARKVAHSFLSFEKVRVKGGKVTTTARSQGLRGSDADPEAMLAKIFGAGELRIESDGAVHMAAFEDAHERTYGYRAREGMVEPGRGRCAVTAATGR